MAPPRPKLAQEEFDEAVRTNLDDFGMEPEDAVESAVEEFELQGYDLSVIIKSANGGNTDSHPVAQATRALADIANNAATSDALGELQAAAAALHQRLRGGGAGEEQQQAVAVAAKDGSVAALVAAARAAEAAAAGGGEDAAAADVPGLLAARLPCLRALRLLMQSPACREALLDAGGVELAQGLLRSTTEQLRSSTAGAEATGAEAAGCGGALRLAAAAAFLAEALCYQDEEAKCRCVEAGLAGDLLALLALLGGGGGAAPGAEEGGAAQEAVVAAAAAKAEGGLLALPNGAAAAAAAAGVLRALATADDERPPASKAFMHARQLAGPPHNALAVLLPVLRRLSSPQQQQQDNQQQQDQQQQQASRPVAALLPVLAAVRQVAANDEICKAFADDGGVDALLALLNAAVVEGPPELVRGAAAALRQLANSDAVKARVVQGGALAPLLRGVRAYAGQLAVQEALLGLLVALVLRMPEHAALAAEAGGVDALVEVLAAAPGMAADAKAAAKAAKAAPAAAAAAAAVNGGGGEDDDEVASKVFGVGASGAPGAASGGAVQRQACMALRNMVVRSAELRQPFLAAGAEQLLRQAKALFPGPCGDVAAAALRDLGLDNYNA